MGALYGQQSDRRLKINLAGRYWYELWVEMAWHRV